MNPESVDAVALPTAKSLRLWPAAALLAALVVTRSAMHVFPDAGMPAFMISAFGPLLVAALTLIWWAFASRANGSERWLGLLGLIAVAAAAISAADVSMRDFCAMLFTVPTGIAAFLLGALLFGKARPMVRVLAPLALAALGFGAWCLVRSDGVRGDFKTDFALRWTPTAEQLFLKEGKPMLAATAAAEPLGAVTWSEFRGPQRDGRAPGIALNPDWKAQPPKTVWRRRIGPGWSSFAVAGDRLFTQEQRGELEAVVCLDARTGATLWAHEAAARFSDSIAGSGPRATPTLADGAVFTLGAAGLLFRLDPLTGAVAWQRDLRKDADRTPPQWGFSSSPLVVAGKVIVHAGGAGEQGVLAYDAKTGAPAWQAASGNHSYASPQLATVAGRQVMLMVCNDGVSTLDPADGKPVWRYAAKYDNYRALQPLLLGDAAMLFATPMSTGWTRVEVAAAAGQPAAATAKWTESKFISDFNDGVEHRGLVFGFDRSFLACLDAATGERQWKQRGYGNGQLLLLPDADQLLVLCETGELALVKADGARCVELARCEALHGKTWNHPVLVGGRAYLRNAEEAACLELPLAAKP